MEVYKSKNSRYIIRGNYLSNEADSIAKGDLYIYISGKDLKEIANKYGINLSKEVKIKKEKALKLMDKLENKEMDTTKPGGRFFGFRKVKDSYTSYLTGQIIKIEEELIDDLGLEIEEEPKESYYLDENGDLDQT